MGSPLGLALSLAFGRAIWPNAVAGWHLLFVDPTLSDDGELLLSGDWDEQAGRDLLTALRHETGHLLGLAHADTGFRQETLEDGLHECPTGGATGALDELLDRVAVPAEYAPAFRGEVLGLLGKKQG
jgi:hypothetical protein